MKKLFSVIAIFISASCCAQRGQLKIVHAQTECNCGLRKDQVEFIIDEIVKHEKTTTKQAKVIKQFIVALPSGKCGDWITNYFKKNNIHYD